MNFLQRIFSIPNVNLGRWHLNYDPKIIYSKFDQANEDHCGCCIEAKSKKFIKLKNTGGRHRISFKKIKI
jgi:hypothetical protein